MTMIFSNEAIPDLNGVYANPKFYDGTFGKATIVYTDNDVIAKQAKEKGLEVKSIKNLKNKPPSKGEDAVIVEQPSAKIVDEPLFAPITSEGSTSSGATTLNEDIDSGMSNTAMMKKHDITKKELTVAKRKLTLAKKK